MADYNEKGYTASLSRYLSTWCLTLVELEDGTTMHLLGGSTVSPTVYGKKVVKVLETSPPLRTYEELMAL